MFGILELAKVELWLQSQLKGEQILNNNNSQTMGLNYPHFSLIKIFLPQVKSRPVLKSYKNCLYKQYVNTIHLFSKIY